MDRIIEVKVSGNHLSKDNKVAGVRGEANVTNLHIAFDEGWDSFSKRITFWDALGNNPTKILLDNKRECVAPIPGEAMAEAGKLTFVIDGYNGGKKQRSVADELEVKDAPMAENAAEPVDPTPDQATQLQNYIDNHKSDKNNPHGVTAGQVGALPIGGGTLKGSLKIKPNSMVSAVRVELDPSDGGTTAKITKTGDTYGEYLDITDYGSADANSEAVTLRLCGEKASTDKSSGVVLINYAKGYGTQYKIYGEHNKPTASDVGAYSTAETDEKLATVEAVAKGRSAGYVFDTEADMFEWLSEEENRSELVLGDNFYIRDTSVPDYWWDATSGQARVLETQKVDLTEYAKTSSVSEGLNKKANKNDVYTRDETQGLLNRKANKSDISNVYKFKGSVKNYGDLPAKMELIPKGTATVDGEALDTVEDGVLKLKGVTLTNPKQMRIPIEPILLIGGMWSDAVLYDADGGYYYVNIGPMDTYGCTEYGYVSEGDVFEVDCVYVNLNYPGTVTFDKDISSLGAVYRVPSQYETKKEGVLYDFSLDIGDVYNLCEDGTNVAWTGTDWDALGGKHEDLEAREEIELINTKLDTKVDGIGMVEYLDAQHKTFSGGVTKIVLPGHTPKGVLFPCEARIYTDEGGMFVSTNKGQTRIFDIKNKESNKVIVVDEATGEETLEDDGGKIIQNLEKTTRVEFTGNGTAYYPIQYVTEERVDDLSEQLLKLANQVAPSPASVTIYADKWVQDSENLWHQVVQVNNATITPYSKVDFQLNVEQFVAFAEKDTALITENDGGTITVYCVRTKTTRDWTIQATVSEVVVNG